MSEIEGKAKIIEENHSNEKVNIGCTIRVRCGDQEFKYTITGSNEADPSQGLISNESPLGRAFIGSKVGDKIKVRVPKGEMECEILEIK